MCSEERDDVHRHGEFHSRVLEIIPAPSYPSADGFNQEARSIATWPFPFMVKTAPLLLTFKSRVEVDIGNPPKLQILEVAGASLPFLAAFISVSSH